MTTVYGDRGQPAGTIDGDLLFDRWGNHSCSIIDGYIYNAEDGRWVGSLEAGIVFNAYGHPVGFCGDCNDAMAPPAPRLTVTLPPKVRAIGPRVNDLPDFKIPDFLSDRLADAAARATKTGWLP